MNELVACFCGGVHIQSDVALWGAGLVTCPDFTRYFNSTYTPLVFISPTLMTCMSTRIPRPEQVW